VLKPPFGLLLAALVCAASTGARFTSSLLNGTVSELTDGLRPITTVKVAQATRDAAGTVW